MTIVIFSHTFDGRPHVQWTARVVAQNLEQIICLAGPGTHFTHHARRIHWQLDHYTLSLFPRREWYNAMLDFDPSGRLLKVYCNVALPAAWQSGRLGWVDLDLDVIMDGQGSARLVDTDEFEANAKNHGYPPDLVEQALRTARHLLERAQAGEPPFRRWPMDEALRYYGCSPEHAWLTAGRPD